MRTFPTAAIVVFLALAGWPTGQAKAEGSNPIYDKKIPPKKRVTSGERNTGKNSADWIFRHICPAIIKTKANPENLNELSYQDLITRLLSYRNLYPSALDELKTKKHFQGHVKRMGAKSAEDALKQCTQVAYEYATGKNAKEKPLSDVCLGERYPVWINLDLIEKYYGDQKKYEETGKGRKPLVFRSRQCLEWARRAMNINELNAHDEALDLKVLGGKPDETTLRKQLNPSAGMKRCDTNDEFKDAFKEIDPRNKDSVFSQREKQTLEMEKDAGVEYVGVRVWYTGRKNKLKDKRNKILYRLTRDTTIRGVEKLKAGTLLENASDKF